MYDGVLPIAEYDGNNNLSRTYTRGLDFSRSFQGAGGIGGLLALTNNTGSYSYFADGNGNIVDITDSYGNSAQHLEYDPFGNIVNQTGSLQQPYQWSSKENDGDGLVYYLYRFYNPSQGRWTNRDPIEEHGGLNIYSFLRNQPTKALDYYGLYSSVHLEAITHDEYFNKLTPAERTAFQDRWVAKFGALVLKSAKANCVPAQLLAFVIFDEDLDYDADKKHRKEETYATWTTLPAMISPDTAMNAELYPSYDEPPLDPMAGPGGPSLVDYLYQLSSADGNIDAAGRLMKQYLNKICKEGGSKAFLRFTGASSNDDLKSFCKLCCDDLVKLYPSRPLAIGMAAIWQSPGSQFARDPITPNTPYQNGNYGASYFMGSNAGQVYDDLNGRLLYK